MVNKDVRVYGAEGGLTRMKMFRVKKEGQQG